MIEPYESLQRVCEQHKKIKKILLMPSYSSGQQLIQSAALRGIKIINLKVETPAGAAGRLLEKHLYNHELKRGSSTTLRLLLFDILKGMAGSGRLQYFNRLELTPGVAGAVCRALHELRMAGSRAAELEAGDFITEKKGEDLINILREYEEGLRAEGLLDEAALYHTALEVMKPPYPEALYILPPVLKLRVLEERFLNKLAPEIEYLNFEPVRGVRPPGSFSRGLKRREGTVPDHSKLSYLHQLEALPGGLKMPEININSAYGESNEVSGVIRQLKKERLPFDRVNILYTTREPYTQLIYNLAGRLELPVTYGEGINIRNTRPGKLYFALLNWLSGNYNARELSRILTGGSFSPAGKLELSPERMAAVVGAVKIGWSRERYLPALEREMKRRRQQLERPEIRGEEKECYRKKLAELGKVKTFIRELFLLLPVVEEGGRQMTYRRDLALGLSKFLSDYSEIKGELDREAREIIINELKLLAEGGADRGAAENYGRQLKESGAVPLAGVLSRFYYLLEGRRVGSSSPRPGHLHLTSYQKGLWQQREVTCILGLDARRFPGEPLEGPVLLDSEKEGLGGMELSRSRTRENSFLLSQLLAALEGSVRLSFSSYNTTEDREESPAAVLLQVYRLLSGDREKDYGDLKEYMDEPVEFIPRAGESLIDESDFWLKMNFREGGFENHDTLTVGIYPDLRRGIRAHLQRYSTEFNQYNGNISVEPEAVDPRQNGRKLSASKLEQLAFCPYKYFLRHILGIALPEEITYDPGVWLDPAARGSLLHRIFELFYREITAKGETPSGKRHQGLIERIAREELLRQREELPPPGETVYRYEAAEILHSCRIFLTSEEDHPAEASPCYFELAFGTGRAVSRELGPLEAVELSLPSGGKIYLGGIIDRVDRIEENKYNIIDYKTGSTRKYNHRDYFKEGRQLQHALYALALEKILERRGERGARVETAEYVFPSLKGEGRRYQRTRKGREKVLEIIDILLDTLSEGNFAQAVCNYKDDECWYCDFLTVCERKKNDIINSLRLGSEDRGIARLRGLEEYV